MACSKDAMLGLMQRQARLVARKDITVSSIIRVIREWCERRGSRDVEKHLRLLLPPDCTWKTAPSARALAATADLYGLLFDIAPNTLLPPNMTKMALKKEHENARLNFGNKSDDDWSYDMGGCIRCGASKFRELADDAVKLERCIRQAV
jgi:hypothetical protein